MSEENKSKRKDGKRQGGRVRARWEEETERKQTGEKKCSKIIREKETPRVCAAMKRKMVGERRARREREKCYRR